MSAELFKRFDPEYASREYSPRDAVAFCLASELAYKDEDGVREQARALPWRSTRVHEGFQDAFLPTALVIGKGVSGHSLGGALAVLLAATLAENGIPVAGLYTFAAPRVGDEAFAEQLNGSLAGKAHWRVVNEADLVPHLPSELRFSHGGERRLLVDGAVTDADGVWDHFKEAIWGWIGRVGRLAALKIREPHSLTHEDGYLPKLLAQVPSEGPR